MAGSNNIKGITVEIGGDTVGLQSALKDVNKTSRNLSNELKQVNRMLEFDPGNVDLLAQRQEILNESIENTENKLSQMRSVYNQVEAQFQRGDIGIDQWRRFQREIIQTERQLEGFQGEIQETEQVAERSGKEISSSLGSAIAGALAGAGAASVIEKAMAAAGLETQIKVAFNVDESEIPAVKEIIQSITDMGIEGEEAIEGVRKQIALNNDLTLDQNKKIVEYAGVISKAYADIDFNELIQESNEFANALEISQEDALAMTNHLLKMGFPPDQLDILTEYGSQMKRAGYNAQEIQGIFAAGVETKSWNIDVLLDGVKEGRIKLAEFSEGVDEATGKMIAGTDISAEKLQGWGKAVAAGGDEGKVAFGQLALELSKIEDSGKRNELGAKFFGTLWEEQGKKITDSMAGASEKTGDLAANAEEMNKALENVKEDPQVRLNKALGEMNKQLAPVLIAVAEFIAKVADWAAENPQLVATITAIATVLGILIGIFTFLAPIVTAIIAAAGFFGVAIGAVAAPVLIVVGVIVALIAICVLLWKNWDVVSEKWKAGVDKINAAIEEWWANVKKRFNDSIQEAKDMVANIIQAFEDWKEGVKKRFNESMDDVKEIWGKIQKFFEDIDLKQIGMNIINGLKDGLIEAASSVYKKAEEIAANVGGKIAKALKIGSPSKLTMELGEFTGLGLAEGLQNSLSRVKSMAGRLAEAAVPNVKAPAAGSGSPTTNNAMNVNIYSPKALDTREATRELNRTMNRMTMFW